MTNHQSIGALKNGQIHEKDVFQGSKGFWKDLAARGPIVALAPMDGYTDGPYRLTVKRVAPHVVAFSEFYSADGLVRSKHLAKEVLPHDIGERPIVFQIFGKDPETFREAAKIIESYGASGVDINMGCPAKKVVKSGHGSSLMINRDTAFNIVEEMAKAVSIPVSVKTRLGWADDSLLVEFCKGLENAGADLITVHGRTYQQAFAGKADFTGIYRLKQELSIPVIANGDITDYDDGILKTRHPANREETIFPGDDELRNSADEGSRNGTMPVLEETDEIRLKSEHRSEAYLPGTMSEAHRNESGVRRLFEDLDGFMIGRSSFGNPWCFLPGKYSPTLSEILSVMESHGQLLVERKGRKGALEARKHLVEYLHGFPGVKGYRTRLVSVENFDDIRSILADIRKDWPDLLDKVPDGSALPRKFEGIESCPVD